MVRVLTIVFAVSALAWIVGEVGLQLRQLFHRGRAKTTELRSYLVIGLAGGFASIAANVLVRRLTLPILPSREFALAVALPVFWIGAGLRLWSIQTLGRFFRVAVHIQEAHEVVRSGPYKVLRHPWYTGLLLAVTGVCLASNNLAVLLVVPPVAVAALLYRIRVEERTMLRELGKPYAAHTSRLIPGIW